MKNFGKQYDSLTPIFYAIPSQGITGTTRIIGTTRGYTGVAVIIETETFGFVHIKKADYNEAN